MKSWDEQEEELDKLTNSMVEEVWKDINKVMTEMDEYHNFLDLWIKVLEENGFKIEKIQTKLKGKKEWDGVLEDS